MQSLTLGDVVLATRGVLLSGRQADGIGKISTDSRSLAKTEFFVPLVGKRFDGHGFLRLALRSGACGCLVARTWKGKTDFFKDLPLGFGVVEVLDTQEAYGDIARFFRNRFHNLSVVGVTGSNGKSTTKEMIAAVLAARFRVYKNEGTLNNLIGVPQTLLGLEAHTRIAVLEMGSSFPGEIARLAAIARPDVGVLTNVGPSHLEFFGDLEGVAGEKGDLAAGLGSPGLYVVNADDPNAWATRSRSKAKVMGFGFSRTADVIASDAHPDPEGRWNFHVRCAASGQETRIALGVMGRHNIANALAAAAVGLHYGLVLEEIKSGLELYSGLKMRMERVLLDGICVINDAYNSNPLAFAKAMETLEGIPSAKRKILVFGDMLELGQTERQAHEEAGRKIARSCVDILITVGSRARWVADIFAKERKQSGSAWHFEEALAAGRFLKSRVRAGDTVLLKGSRGMKLEQVLEQMRDSRHCERSEALCK